MVAMKNKFLDESSTLRRSALIYLICKIYFTDGIANLLKLRITADEFQVFKSFIDKISNQPDYEAIKIIFHQLYSEDFFKFTMKNKELALDFGSDKDNEPMLDPFEDEKFWNEIRNEINALEKKEIVELTELSAHRSKALKPFEDVLPKENPLAQALSAFEAVKNLLQKPEVAVKATRKGATQARRDNLTPRAGPSQVRIKREQESDEDYSTPKSSARKHRKKRSSSSESSDSEENNDFKRMIRTMGFQSQNVMRGIGATSYTSEKLKSCYEPKS